jgi:hypothetical protein
MTRTQTSTLPDHAATRSSPCERSGRE